jgi:hypothetical protein
MHSYDKGVYSECGKQLNEIMAILERLSDTYGGGGMPFDRTLIELMTVTNKAIAELKGEVPEHKQGFFNSPNTDRTAPDPYHIAGEGDTSYYLCDLCGSPLYENETVTIHNNLLRCHTCTHS